MADCANCDGYAADLSAALARAVRLRARLAEVEAERDAAFADREALHEQVQYLSGPDDEVSARARAVAIRGQEDYARAEAAEARLAAVDRLVQQAEEREEAHIPTRWVRAAARGEGDPLATVHIPANTLTVGQVIRFGEGDRPVEHHDTEDAHGNPICVCPDLRGEGDRPAEPCAHRSPPDMPDEVIAWRCTRCGEVVRD